ncbi:MAG: hypothetical protein S4CHLAM7_07680 [Chlamydiae bacterium]|nr:hypothetical protein [Chlamydiota bacterium]
MTKIILITGCSSGLGLVLAKELSKQAIVYASMRNLDKIKAFLDDKSISFHPIQIDVTQPKSIDLALALIQKKHATLDVLVNNAGVMHMGSFGDTSEKELRRIFETNFFGVSQVTKRALGLLKKSKDARVINISSSSGLTGMPSLSAYAASKWAVEGLSESLRFELQTIGIKVLLIEPGLIRTPLIKDNFSVTQSPNSEFAPLMKTLFSKWESLNPKNFLDPESVALTIVKRIYQKKPPFRTVLSNLSKLKFFLKKIVPYSIYEWIIRKSLSI